MRKRSTVMNTMMAAAVMVVLGAAGAAAQDPPSLPSPQAGPRVEVGGGMAWQIPVTSNGGGAWASANLRAGVALNRTWALEGVFDLRTSNYAAGGFYRIQAKWAPAAWERPGLRTHITFGGGGSYALWSRPQYRYTDYDTGQPAVMPASSGWQWGAPMLPNVGIGVQKTLGEHLAVRADITAAFGISDYGIETMILPTIGVSIPIGRYPAARR
jgi:hypothetical protein